MRGYGGRPPSQYYDPVHHASAGWYPHQRSTSASDPSSWAPQASMNNPFAYQLGPGPAPGFPMSMNMNMSAPYSPFGPPPMDNMHRHAQMQQSQPPSHHLPNPANTAAPPTMYSERSFSVMPASPRGMNYHYQASADSPAESSNHGPQELQTRAPNSSHTIQFGTAPAFSSQRPPATFVPLRSRVPQASPSDARSSIDSGPSAAHSERQPETRRRAASGRRARGFMSSRLYPPASDGIGPGDGLLGHYLGRDDDEDLRVTQLLRGSIRTKQVVSSAAIRSLQSVPLSELDPHEMTCVICYNDYGVETPEGLKEAPLRLPKCKHVFGDHCIKKWFEDSDSCPYCRDKLQSEPRVTAGPHQEYIRDMLRAQGRIPRGVHTMTASSVARALVAQQPGVAERNPTHSQAHGAGPERRSPPTDDEESHRRQRPRHTSWGSGLTVQQQQQQQSATGRPGSMTDVPQEAGTAEGHWLAGSHTHRAVTPPAMPSLAGGRGWVQQPPEPNQTGGWTGAPFETSRPFYGSLNSR
ncbi:conserved hypothetical protein [Verticillium alfalfae VaMs.102]|uniref:RING-type domain-containing protein n=1 Tax=Verticillium alfalfae (strain VaMs.102 / ATCC MYA-4576 / FGSC 10136) TaxID=526221 RepID=C9SJJ3_VERA1|nr:conserved hypothetical protein [Verticillium alfalfae VaMs.102]EEY18355.1 conserved hypothetical protein [Verticillium alfalfae VaMs.102]